MHAQDACTSVVPGRLELPTSTLSVWRSDQLSYRTGHRRVFTLPRFTAGRRRRPALGGGKRGMHRGGRRAVPLFLYLNMAVEAGGPECGPENFIRALQKGGVPAAPSGTATLLRLSPSHRSYPRTTLAVTYFRHSRLPWLDGRCVQGPGTYSPRHG